MICSECILLAFLNTGGSNPASLGRETAKQRHAIAEDQSLASSGAFVPHAADTAVCGPKSCERGIRDMSHLDMLCFIGTGFIETA